MVIYPPGTKMTFVGVLMTNGQVRLQANDPLRSINIDLADFEPATIAIVRPEIGDIVSLYGARFMGEEYKLIGIDGKRAWVRNLCGLERFDIDYTHTKFLRREDEKA